MAQSYITTTTTPSTSPMNPAAMLSAKELLRMLRSSSTEARKPKMYIPENVRDALEKLNKTMQSVPEGETPSAEQWLTMREAMLDLMGGIVAQAIFDDMSEKNSLEAVDRDIELRHYKQELALEAMKYEQWSRNNPAPYQTTSTTNTLF